MGYIIPLIKFAVAVVAPNIDPNLLVIKKEDEEKTHPTKFPKKYLKGFASVQ